MRKFQEGLIPVEGAGRESSKLRQILFCAIQNIKIFG